MARFNFEKQGNFLMALAEIYDSQNEALKNKILKEDFLHMFPIVEVNGIATYPSKPRNVDITDELFERVIAVFENIYR